MPEKMEMPISKYSGSDLDSEPDVIFVRRYLLPVGINCSIAAIAFAHWALTL